MKFAPKTEKQIAEENLWPAGEYGFEIGEAHDKVSKSNNEMIHLKLKVFNNEGSMRFVDDYLLEEMAYKLRHAAEACGLLTQYESGTLLASDFVGKLGYLKLKIQKDKTGNYPDKNVVGDYIVKDVVQVSDDTSPPTGHPASAPMNDEVPW
jgi:hypothetical protein